MRTLPTKLVGNLTHTPINTPIEAICEILIISNTFITFLHHSNCFAVSIIAVAFASVSKTLKTPPTKLAGNLTHTPMNNSIETICEVLIIFIYSAHSYPTLIFFQFPLSLYHLHQLAEGLSYNNTLCRVVWLARGFELFLFSQKYSNTAHLNRCSNDQ
jgi:hypothetical protein